MIKKIITILAMAILLTGQIYAQQTGNFPDQNNQPSKSSFSLLDPSRLHMSQSFSLMYGSTAYGSRSIGMYLNSIEYQVSDPLKIRLDLGYIQNAGALFGTDRGYLDNGRILPSISINWKPSNNLFFQFNYREIPSYYYGDRYDDYRSDHMFYERGRGY